MLWRFYCVIGGVCNDFLSGSARVLVSLLLTTLFAPTTLAPLLPVHTENWALSREPFVSWCDL